jgi:(E)-4-hydroxy-3-methylbut-2-enyl-diphosphate synthase
MQDHSFCNSLTNYKRRKTIRVNIGNTPLGSDYPTRIQSMANASPDDIHACVRQGIRIILAGADYLRFTVPSFRDADNLALVVKELRQLGHQTPVIADVHFNSEVALRAAELVEKVRINPGNFTAIGKHTEMEQDNQAFMDGLEQVRTRLRPLLAKCRDRGVALRVGVNHGSLSERIMSRFGDTPAGMAESAMEYLRICRDEKFDQVVVSMKASNVRVMVQATRLVVMMMEKEGLHLPLHLGVTEAGEGEDGRIKSAAGIGTLLADGLGDTIRVSLTEDPEKEIPVARKLAHHVAQLSAHAPLPEIPPSSLDLFTFNRRVSRTVGNIGGNQPPVVIGSDNISGTRMNLVTASFGELTDSLISDLTGDPEAVLIYRCTNANVQAELRWLSFRLRIQRSDIPVIFQLHLAERDPEDFLLKSAASLGGAFIDGFGDGIWLTNEYPISHKYISSTAFGILQACRARMMRTEYISCPSCGRTHFNLMETLARIKARTSHLKGLKIGVMGCIVNGPGEMADADYGYVGAGKGKITLYRSKQVIKKGIPEEDAVDELVSLIKENGDWVEP